jgi:hypothetical protein
VKGVVIDVGREQDPYHTYHIVSAGYHSGGYNNDYGNGYDCHL